MKKLLFLLFSLFLICACASDNMENNVIEKPIDPVISYDQFNIATLKDNSKWLILKEEGDYVYLLATESKFEASFTAIEGEFTIDEYLNDYIILLSESLNKSEANLSGFEVKIPSLTDFTSFFNIEEDNIFGCNNGDRCGIYLKDEVYDNIQEYYDGTYLVNSLYPEDETKVVHFILSKSFHSFYFAYGGSDLDKKLDVLPMVKILKENIISAN